MTDGQGAARVAAGVRTGVGRGLLALALLSPAACASVRGRPAPITAADVVDRVCPTGAQLDQFQALTGDARGAFRDRVVSICLAAYNRRYAQFTASLSEEGNSTNLAVDVASSGLTTLAGIAAPKVAKRLTAGAGFALGIGAAVNKDLFYQAALPALLAAIDARRAVVLTAIIEAEKADPQGINYSLARASLDLDRFEEAGTLATGVNELAHAAETARNQASQQLAAAQRAPTLTFTPVVLDDAVVDRVAVLTGKVRNLADTPADRAKLDALAAKLGLLSAAKDSTDQKIGYVVTAILENVNVASPADQQARIAALERDLGPLL